MAMRSCSVWLGRVTDSAPGIWKFFLGTLHLSAPMLLATKRPTWQTTVPLGSEWQKVAPLPHTELGRITVSMSLSTHDEADKNA